MLEILIIRGVLRGDLWAGTHITINDKLSEGIQHFKNCFGIVKAGASRAFNRKCEVGKCFVTLVRSQDIRLLEDFK